MYKNTLDVVTKYCQGGKRIIYEILISCYIHNQFIEEIILFFVFDFCFVLGNWFEWAICRKNVSLTFLFMPML